ncbi:hypothetical protein [Candidatus Thiodictyon syntrophicum]|jgi:putative ABC transport system permease protein|uniref:ABC3 transporter permease protein domain-containing protein n=1 Tax=Candidatus Thiodictyon syntrophicum TaxID=1166950 RepID=A0A2K8U9L4_9GAMM|nr:hypothetical protein [Candidatus Thiodictyon syntrophicum]AUB82099.1 hypothetical protein THSYN_14845 [Candidatus Thiodictyon syntrophicum]
MPIGDWRHTVDLAWADLRYEWILSLCMVLALGAVFAPLFILLGLRVGIIGTMLDRLDQDPLSRLIMPKYPLQAPLDHAFVAALKARSEVLIQSPVPFLLLDIEGLKEPLNALPTAVADPLLRGHGLTLPTAGPWVVLSARLAQDTGKGPGDVLSVVLKRSTPQGQEVAVGLPVAGVLPQSIGVEPKLWIPDSVFRWFSDWRRGLPVPALGLAGAGGGLVPEYDGFVTLLARVPSDGDYRRMLTGRGGFSQMPQAIDALGWDLPTGLRARLWSPVNSRVFEDDRPKLRNRHLERGYEAEVIPYLDRFRLSLESGQHSVALNLVVLPEEPIAGPGEAGSDGLPPVWVSTDEAVSTAEPAKLSFTSVSGSAIEIPVRPVPTKALHAGFAAVPKVLAGKMNAARRQAAVFDPATGEVFPAPDGDRFFRAYAPSIDAVEGLATWLRQRGEATGDPGLKEPVSREAEVRQVRTLSRHMQTLYVLIVAVTGVSGFFAIAANVYAGVQRKRRDLAYLQLLGLRRGTLLFITTLKSLILVAGGLVAALCAYAAFAFASGSLFAGLGGGTAGALTRLGVYDALWLVSGILGAAAAASVLAAAAIARIDPAEYLRE